MTWPTPWDPYGIYADPIGHWIVVVVACLLMVGAVLTVTAHVVYAERRVMGLMQKRPGPNRVGPAGLLQMAADGVKLVFKESFIPADVDKFTYLMAPMIGVIAALVAWTVVPIGLAGPMTYWVANVNIGILLIFGVSAMNVYAIMLGGWSSNNKYSLLGGLRSAAQLISYEMALGLALVPTFMIVGSLRLQDIAAYHVHWFGQTFPIPLLLLTPVGFLIYIVAAVAETNRAPFDLPEAEQELTGGFLTEYSGLKFMMFYLAEYMNVLLQSVLIVILFLGGSGFGGGPIPGFFVLFAKVLVLVFCFIWLRATVPRLRYDRLMRLGWKVMLPLALANVVVTAVVVELAQG
ncbi:MAG TPA: NADH-quinone oxidoreductase subunit NuoH [Candidatus Dormibacteraeota bacterium]|nr:NADH-quinone oxidoreductase subunit NuoH [Candidatus Dormibacteraeota bacterium]